MIALIKQQVYRHAPPSVRDKIWRLIKAAPKLFPSRAVKMLFVLRSPRTLFRRACRRGTKAFKQGLSQRSEDVIEEEPPQLSETLSAASTLVHDETASLDTKRDEIPQLIVTTPSGDVFVLQDKMPMFRGMRKKKKQKRRRDKWRKSSMLSPLWVPREGPKPCDVKRFTTVGYLLKKPSRGRWIEIFEETRESIESRRRQRVALTRGDQPRSIQSEVEGQGIWFETFQIFQRFQSLK